jgi:hypothetical protein
MGRIDKVKSAFGNGEKVIHRSGRRDGVFHVNAAWALWQTGERVHEN